MFEKKPQIVPRSNVETAICPMCGNIHALRQVRKDYDPQVEAVFCNRCGKVSVHELQKAGLPP